MLSCMSDGLFWFFCDGLRGSKKVRHGWRVALVGLALPVEFVSTFFDNLMTEEICGRFGSFRWINVCISTPVGFWPDDPVSASLFGRTSFLWKRCTSDR